MKPKPSPPLVVLNVLEDNAHDLIDRAAQTAYIATRKREIAAKAEVRKQHVLAELDSYFGYMEKVGIDTDPYREKLAHRLNNPPPVEEDEDGHVL